MAGATLSALNDSHKDWVKEGGTVTITGTFTATFTLQQRLQNGTWEDIATYTAPATDKIDAGENMIWFRVICTAYTSGSAYVEFA